MTEMMGLSSMAEIPAVIVDCQRAGPATGMPSRTEQSDLFHALYAGHGDFPRVVLGVFDSVHARHVMFKALHIAETYQLPVLAKRFVKLPAIAEETRGWFSTLARDPPPVPDRGLRGVASRARVGVRRGVELPGPAPPLPLEPDRHE
jgi:Pyruvate flavodoxin/ferredoxin oxidoreductase, thiamine diP-bdg